MPRTSKASPTKGQQSASQTISNEILNGDTSQSGVGLPNSSSQNDVLNLSTTIVQSSATGPSNTSSSSPLDFSSSKKTSAMAPLPKSPRRPRSPSKKAPIRMQFLDSDSEDEGTNFSALKTFYRDLNAVEHSSLLQLYSKCVDFHGRDSILF